MFSYFQKQLFSKLYLSLYFELKSSLRLPASLTGSNALFISVFCSNFWRHETPNNNCICANFHQKTMVYKTCQRMAIYKINAHLLPSPSFFFQAKIINTHWKSKSTSLVENIIFLSPAYARNVNANFCFVFIILIIKWLIFPGVPRTPTSYLRNTRVLQNIV